MNIWFFMRHYNDIDNIAPAVYFLLRRKDTAQATIILYDEGYSPDGDENLQMLVREFGERVRVMHIADSFGIEQHRGSTSRRAASRLRLALEKLKYRLPTVTRKLKMALKRAHDVTSRMFAVGLWRLSPRRAAKPLDVSWIRRGLVPDSAIDDALARLAEEVGQPRLAVFDINRSGEVIGLVAGLRRMGVKRVICLPVSPLISTNVLRDHKHIRISEAWFRKAHDYSVFDVVGYVDETYVKSYSRVMELLGLPNDLQGKVKRLGSIRYCQDWVQQREELLGLKSVIPANLGRRNEQEGPLDILLLLSNSSSNVDAAELQRTLEFICQFTGYRVTVKGHTRRNELSLADASSNVRFDGKTTTSDLIRSADLILFWSTSSAVEGYVRGKFMVCLSYLSCNDNLYAKFDAGYVAHTRDDLLEVLVRFPSERHLLKYNVDGVRRFLDEVVECGSSGQTVPERYVEFLVEEARKGGATTT